ncbi:MAG: hypothetical protein V4690_04270 [Patescibacteria group bacterium]
MPCRSDYLEPTTREQELQRAAKLLVYVRRKMGIEPEDWALSQSGNIYANDDRAVIELCAALTSMTSDVLETIVYNPHDAESRDLADWWEVHQAADAEREKREAEQAQDEETKKSALAKLSPAERKALKV